MKRWSAPLATAVAPSRLCIGVATGLAMDIRAETPLTLSYWRPQNKRQEFTSFYPAVLRERPLEGQNKLSILFV
jgi:hypothetical protein